ncbi:hypothetical protein ACIKTA_03950 [Hansschlegelia beijingensis]
MSIFKFSDIAPKPRWVPKTPRGAVRMVATKFLAKKGWLDSALAQRPIDAAGGPLPSHTYALISFLEPRLNKDLSVFEYGSGNSTLWYSERVGRVVSVEYEESFVEETSIRAPSNVEYRHREPNGPQYWGCVLEGGSKYDIVVVDGIHRYECAIAARAGLTDRGVVIVDNTDSKRHGRAVKPLLKAGFRRLDFRSMGPIWSVEWTTSIFYKPDNCLGI